MKPITNRKKLLSLLISQALVASAQATVIDVNCGNVTDLINAINTANSNSDADEINLNVDNQVNCVYPLTAVNNTTAGANGLPSVTSNITINGNQSAIRRQDGSESFRIVHVAETGNLTLKQLSIENGLTTDSGSSPQDLNGGGIFNDGELTLEDSTVSENTANQFGGGIINSHFSTTTLTNSTVAENITIERDGGGIDNFDNSIVILTNSTVAGNTAARDGGGIANALNSTVTFINSTISGNNATTRNGGGILNEDDSTATLQNTILAGNTANSNPDCFNDNSILITNHYNLLGGDGTECNAGTTDLTLIGLGKTITDVLNPTLADNGGPTQTLALVANSPAIDAADDAVCPETDQRGVSRPQGAKCDIGAFEYQKPDLIELGDFQAIATSQGIYLKWITTSASDNAGFRLWRANLDQYGGYTNITALDNPQAQTLTTTPLEAVTDWSHLIAAGSSTECYSYLDAGATQAGTTYFYLLEDIDMGGYRTLHWDDIVSATVGQNSNDNSQCEDE